MTFEEHLWDKLPQIQRRAHSGTLLLKEFAKFGRNFNESLTRFGKEVSQHYDLMINSLDTQSDEQKSKGGLYNLIDHNYFGNGKDLATDELKTKIQVLGINEKDADELANCSSATVSLSFPTKARINSMAN